MDFMLLLRRQIMVFLVVAIGAALTVYFFNEWWVDDFLPAIGLRRNVGGALGSLLMISVAFIGQRMVSTAIYRDWLFGMQTQQENTARLNSAYVSTTEQVAEELHQIGTYNNVVRGQLDSVIKETEQAAFDIASRLQTIDGVVTQLSSFVDTSSHESNEMLAQSEARIVRNRELIGTLDQYIKERIVSSETDRQNVEHVVREAQSLGSLVQLIRSISKQTNLLALNAAIEAARAGDVGRGFAVVADEVRKLSGDTDKAVTQIDQGIRAVSVSIESHFKDKMSIAHIEAERTALQSFAVQLDDLGKSYQEVTDHEAQVMVQIHTSSQQLVEMFMNALASVQFQDVTRQQIEQVIDALNRLDSHAFLLADRLNQFEDSNFELQPLSQHLAQMYGNYVMSSQRDSHHAAMGNAPAKAGSVTGGPKIELF
ncbi:MAG: methyl-accepting chemotaxis protein [Sterolibacterium sp.]|jgi:methyl-accepting chemotaxis protein